MQIPHLQSDFGFTDDATALRALRLVRKDRLDALIADLPQAQAAWVAETGFTATAGSLCLLSDVEGKITSALLGVGETPIWDMAAAASTLPAGTWQLETDLDTDLLYLGWGLAQYKFRSVDTDTSEAARLYHPDPDGAIETLSLLAGTTFCRDLINLPANIMTPAGLERAAHNLASACEAEISVTVGEVLEDTCPALHIVGRAAEVPPRLIDMKWGTEGPLITLIGKGITFDTGGLDLKPSRAMEMMKKDMGGAAHTLGLAAAIMKSNLPVRLRVLIAAAENSVSDRSMRPLDIIETAAGTKVEVGNTDAEGRLVLADALYYAKQDAPDLMLDFATLTGAARVALGTECPALFANDDAVAQRLVALGMAHEDPLWQLPLFAPYKRMLKTDHGALSSTGSSGYGGAITAALFLQHFAGESLNWLHIDVMAWNLSNRPGRPRGGEAMGLRACYALIKDMAEA